MEQRLSAPSDADEGVGHVVDNRRDVEREQAIEGRVVIEPRRDVFDAVEAKEDANRQDDGEKARLNTKREWALRCFVRLLAGTTQQRVRQP